MKMLVFLLLIPMTIYSQVFEVYDIDKSNFPSLSAKITSSYQNGTRILNQDVSEFNLTENGVNRTVKNIKYNQGISEKTSTVIIIDMNNMYIPYRDYTKNVAKYWVESLSDGSECSIISINDTNQLVQEFTEDRTTLIDAIEGINRTNQTTKIENAFIKPPNSGFQQIQKAKNDRKNIIVFSNSYDSNIDIESIVNSFNSLNTSIYFISMLDNYKKNIDSVCKGTNGQYFTLLSSESLINKELNIILARLEQSNALIEWDSEYNCSENVKVSIYNSQNQMTTESNYTKTEEIMARLKITPEFINFGELPKGSFKDTTINVYASNTDLYIEDFQFEYGSSNFTIADVLPIVLMKGESIDLHLRYSPTDSTKSYTQYNIVTNYCSNPVYLLGGYKYQDTIIEATTITSPIKNDYYLYKDDIVINWTNIPNFDRYILKFTSNNGSNWTTLSDSVMGTTYTWQAPHANSDKCAFRVEPYIEPEKNMLEVEWDKYIGISREDISRKLIQTSDGGYLTVGITRGKDSSSNKELFNDILICKMNKDGNQLWAKIYGGKEGEDVINSVVESDDKCYMLIGHTNSSDFQENLKGKEDILLMKIDEQGNLLWKKNYGGSNYDIGIDIEKDKDGNFYLGGYTGSIDGDIISTHGWADFIALKVNKDGNIIWTNTYGWDKDELLKDIQISIDGGLILFGSSNSRDSIYMGDKYGSFEDKEHGLVIKVNSDGIEEWDYQYAHGRDQPYIITESAKGDIFASGYTVYYYHSMDVRQNLWLLKLNKLGELIWYKRDANLKGDVPLGIKITDGNEILLCTEYFSNSGFLKRITKYSSLGNTSYYKDFPFFNFTGVNGFCSTFDNGMAFIGTRTDRKKDVPFNYNLVKISNEYLFKIAYSGLFEIASSKPHFTIDTISFPIICGGEKVDTLIKDMICNDGVLPVEIINFSLPKSGTELKIDSVCGDNILEPGECMDIGFSFSPINDRPVEHNLQVDYSIGRSADNVYIRGNAFTSKLSLSNLSFYFIDVIENQKSDVKYLKVKNHCNSPIEVHIEKYKIPYFVINNGIDDFIIDAQKEIEIPIYFHPNFLGRLNMDFTLVFDGNKTSETVSIVGTAIKNPVTSVISQNKHSSSISINPNPASEQLNIDITTGVQGTMKLELVATDGRVIYSDEWTQSTKTKQMKINTREVPSGLYQVRLITPYDAITKSVIVVE